MLVGISVRCERKRLDRPGDGDRLRRDDDLVDEAAGITLPDLAGRRARLGEENLAKPLDRLRRDPSLRGRELALDEFDLTFEVCAPDTLRGEPGGEVAGGDHALLDEVEHVLDGTVDPRPFGAARLEPRLPLAHGGHAVVGQVREQLRPNNRLARASTTTISSATSRMPGWSPRPRDGYWPPRAVRLALRRLLAHCPERWPLTMFWDAVAQENDIGRAQGCTASFNRIIRQLRAAKYRLDVM